MHGLIYPRLQMSPRKMHDCRAEFNQEHRLLQVPEWVSVHRSAFLGLQMLLPQTEHFFLGGTWQSYVLNKIQHIKPASGGKPQLTQ